MSYQNKNSISKPTSNVSLLAVELVCFESHSKIDCMSPCNIKMSINASNPAMAVKMCLFCFSSITEKWHWFEVWTVQLCMWADHSKSSKISQNGTRMWDILSTKNICTFLPSTGSTNSTNVWNRWHARHIALHYFYSLLWLLFVRINIEIWIAQCRSQTINTLVL